MRRVWWAVAAVLALAGCATAPERAPIVRRERPLAPHVIKRSVPKAAPVEDEAAPLSAADKEALFRAFETYLQRTAPPK